MTTRAVDPAAARRQSGAAPYLRPPVLGRNAGLPRWSRRWRWQQSLMLAWAGTAASQLAESTEEVLPTMSPLSLSDAQMTALLRACCAPRARCVETQRVWSATYRGQSAATNCVERGADVCVARRSVATRRAHSDRLALARDWPKRLMPGGNEVRCCASRLSGFVPWWFPIGPISLRLALAAEVVPSQQHDEYYGKNGAQYLNS